MHVINIMNVHYILNIKINNKDHNLFLKLKNTFYFNYTQHYSAIKYP